MNSIVREEIVKWISQMEDNELLETLKLIKDSSSTSKDWYKDLSDQERASIKQGLNDHQFGRTMSSSAFWKEHG